MSLHIASLSTNIAADIDRIIAKKTQFGANRSRTGGDMAFCVFSKIAAAAILKLIFLHLGPPTVFLMLGSMLPANGVIMSLNLSKTLRF